MKVGFAITSHYSDEIRPQGREILDRLIESIITNCEYDFNIVIVDNQSEHELSYPDDDRISYIRIDDQYEKGLTGAWNVGIKECYDLGCKLILNCNDDLWFDDSINKLIGYVENDMNEDIVYTALTNGIWNHPQQSDKPQSGTHTLHCGGDMDNTVAGFFFGFTNEHYDKYKFTEDEYFNKDNKYNGGDGIWGGQEGQFQENAEKGMCGLIVKECFVKHDKFRHWIKARNVQNEKK